MKSGDISRCEEMVKDIMTDNRYKQILTQLSGSNLLIKCSVCPDSGTEGNSKGYLEINPLQITICTNKLRNTKESYQELLSHELTHAYDYLQDKCDFNTCEGLAYSEVRAAREGECNGFFLHDYFRHKCIKNHAIRSTAVSIHSLSLSCMLIISFSSVLRIYFPRKMQKNV